jgi:hypothetical protein
MAEEKKRARIPKLVEIDETYSVRVDDYGYSLIRTYPKKNAKTGETALGERVVGYFYDIQDTLKGYVREVEREGANKADLVGITGLMDTLSEKEKTLRETASRLVSERLALAEGKQTV